MSDELVLGALYRVKHKGRFKNVKYFKTYFTLHGPSPHYTYRYMLYIDPEKHEFRRIKAR